MILTAATWDYTQITVAGITVLGVIVSSGVIQFFVKRKDDKRLAAENKKFEELRKEFKEGLDERERTGRHRYEEHHIEIEKMTLQHQKDFQALQEAIKLLTDNDTKITQSIEAIAEKQDVMAASLVGQAHDRIMYLSDKIIERGAITNKEKATIKSMYDPYHSLGGNGEVQEAVAYILTLRTVTDDEARELDLENKGRQYQEVRQLYEKRA